MKKSLKFIIPIVVLLIIAIVVLIINLNKKPNGPEIIDPTPTESGDTSLAAKTVVETVRIENKTDNKYIECEYPKITSFKSASRQNYINTQIVNSIQQYRQEIEYVVDEETLPTELYRYVTSYEKLTYGNYLFLIVSQEYDTGGIRSNRWKDVYSIDVSTEEFVYLDKMFAPGVKYESAIISEITKQSEQKNIELMGGNGISKIPQKQSFYIKDSKLYLYYAPAEVAANVFGELTFEMPFKLNENGTFDV